MRRTTWLGLALVVFACLAVAPRSASAQFRFQAAISASTGYSDNIQGLPEPLPGTDLNANPDLRVVSGGVTNVNPAITIGYGTARVNFQALGSFSLNTVYSPDADPAATYQGNLNLLTLIQAGPRTRVTFGVLGSIGKQSGLVVPGGNVGAAIINQDITFWQAGVQQAVQTQIGARWRFEQQFTAGFFRPIDEPAAAVDPNNPNATPDQDTQGSNLEALLGFAVRRQFARFNLGARFNTEYLANLELPNDPATGAIQNAHQLIHTLIGEYSRRLGRRWSVAVQAGAQIAWKPVRHTPEDRGVFIWPTATAALNYAVAGWQAGVSATHAIEINLMLGQSIRATGANVTGTIPIGSVLRSNLFLRLTGSYQWQEPLNIPGDVEPGAHVITGNAQLTYRFAANFAIFASYTIVKQIDTATFDPNDPNAVEPTIGDMQRHLALAGVTAGWPGLTRQAASGGGSVLLRRANNPTQLTSDQDWKRLFDPNPGRAAPTQDQQQKGTERAK